MKYSILIVSYNRTSELIKTLSTIGPLIDIGETEVLIMLDGFSEDINPLESTFPQFYWEASKIHLGASLCRNIIYRKAKGEYLVGLDDDANPIQFDFLQKVDELFTSDLNLGIISFYELKMKTVSDDLMIPQLHYYTNDFIGCGFAIRNDVYKRTNGFPVWMDIYGEEKCVATEVFNLGYKILFTSNILVHHRVDKLIRKNTGYEIFRFNKSLINQSLYFIVYYPLLLIPIKLVKLYTHNLLKYGLLNFNFFYTWASSLFTVFKRIPYIVKYRKPIKLSILESMSALPNPKY